MLSGQLKYILIRLNFYAQTHQHTFGVIDDDSVQQSSSSHQLGHFRIKVGFQISSEVLPQPRCVVCKVLLYQHLNEGGNQVVGNCK